MAKVVTVILLGKAIEEEKIKSTDENFYKYFDKFEDTAFSKPLTLKNLAQMEAGLNWKEDKSLFLSNAKAMVRTYQK